MSKRLVLVLLGACSLLVASLVALAVALGVEWGGTSRSAPEPLPQQTAGVDADTNHYRSEVKGYSIVFPKDWTETPSYIKIGATSTDVFYSLNTSKSVGVVPTLSITSELLPPGATLEDYLEVRLGYLDAAQTRVSEPTRVDLDGVKAYLVDYDGYARNTAIEATSVVLVKDDLGWEFTFSVPAGQRSQYRPLLASVLRSVTIP